MCDLPERDGLVDCHWGNAWRMTVLATWHPNTTSGTWLGSERRSSWLRRLCRAQRLAIRADFLVWAFDGPKGREPDEAIAKLVAQPF